MSDTAEDIKSDELSIGERPLNIPSELPAIAAQVDRPIAGLLTDLKARGLLEDTLVIWSTEFGRQPFSQGSLGRDHNGGTFVGLNSLNP